jgi:alpha-galactosidase
MKALFRSLCPAILAVAVCWSAPVKDISGVWVAKATMPMGELEIVYRLHVDSEGNITGSQSLPFGDAPITSGKVDGENIDFTVELESFGNIQKREVKGTIVGDELHLVPAMPGPPPGAGGNGPGSADAARPPRPRIGMVIARRGTPTPSYRVSVDYKNLPHVDLPPLTDVQSIGVANTPPMGWNSWNKFRTKINDKQIREIADAMVESGMRDAGYLYVNIDDGWQSTRDDKGVLRPNPNFPDMKSLAAYVHSKGLKLGIYSSPGPQTCGGFTGSYGHEDIDAKTWADLGIDYLKYDWCSASRIWKDSDMQASYQRMGAALKSTGRPIVFALCQYGRANVPEWGPKVGANVWRTTGDIRDQWQSMSTIGFSQTDLARYVGPGRWNDPDMLEVGNGGMTSDEERTHFSLWAMIAAPLLAGNDLRQMSPEVKEILLNKDVIAVDQDTLGRGGHRVAKTDAGEVWIKPLAENSYAVALFNRSEKESKVSANWSDLGISGPFRVRDLWKHEDGGTANQSFAATVPAHGVVMVRLTPQS